MGKIQNTKKFLSEAKQELKKVVWPSKAQTVSATKVVIIFVAILAAFLGLADFIFGNLIKLILG